MHRQLDRKLSRTGVTCRNSGTNSNVPAALLSHAPESLPNENANYFINQYRLTGNRCSDVKSISYAMLYVCTQTYNSEYDSNLVFCLPMRHPQFLIFVLMLLVLSKQPEAIERYFIPFYGLPPFVSFQWCVYATMTTMTTMTTTTKTTWCLYLVHVLIIYVFYVYYGLH